MCGRYTAAFSRKELEDCFRIGAGHVEFFPRYNIAPTQRVPVISAGGGPRVASLMRWGIKPSWSKTLLINARQETLASKRSFRPLLSQRCLVPADGFFEWKAEERGKVPYRVSLPGVPIFAFAGLWGQEASGDTAFVIITAEAAPSLQSLHGRMPVILSEPLQHQVWLEAPLPEAVTYLSPYLGEVSVKQVSTVVNSPRNDDIRCIQEST